MTSTNTPVSILPYSNPNAVQGITSFTFNTRFSVRTHKDLKGHLWFAAVDVCAALDIKNSRQALTKLDEDEKGVISSDTLGGKQTITTVSESGLYELIFNSRKSEAKLFKKWVKQTVLPALRRDGMYAVGEEGLLSDCTTEAEINARIGAVSDQLKQMADAKVEKLKAERLQQHKEELEARASAFKTLSRGRKRKKKPYPVLQDYNKF